MWHDVFKSFSLIDISGYVIILAIILSLVLGLLVSAVVRGIYGSLERDLLRHTDPDMPFRHRVLNKIVRDAEECLSGQREINSQALIELHFKRELKGALMGERFVKSSTGLMIILGLVGTFYGLTLSIGKLVALISGDVSGVTQITESLTKGLAEALSGMSVAFSTSLVGIVSAIIMTLLGVFLSLPDKRTAIMVRLESYLDNVLPGIVQPEGPGGTDWEDAGVALADQTTAAVVENFGQSVSALENAVSQFDAALKEFSNNTRDFQEFNLHLKDNIQRMSLSFADFSDSMKTHEMPNRSRDPR
jgi:hypothetical protein